MLKTILAPFTADGPAGTGTRDITIIIGAILAVVGAFGWLTPQQIADLRDQVGPMLTALGIVIAGGMSIYRIIAKSLSARAVEAGRAIDAKVAPDEKATVKTEGGKVVAVVQPK